MRESVAFTAFSTTRDNLEFYIACQECQVLVSNCSLQFLILLRIFSGRLMMMMI